MTRIVPVIGSLNSMLHHIMKFYLVALLISASTCLSYSQRVTIDSPDKRINVGLFNSDAGDWFLKVVYKSANASVEVIPMITLGLSRNDQEFSKELRFLKAGAVRSVVDQYDAPHGKRSARKNQGNEVVVSFENPGKAKMNLIIRLYNDGLAFRYEFPEKQGTFVVKDEYTSYLIPENAKRWLQKWNPANERFYTIAKGKDIERQDYGYPALFQAQDSSCFYLLHEADLDKTYCGSKLSNAANPASYKIMFPDENDGRGQGSSTPTITLPWKSPWRVVMLGSLPTLVESTLVDDVSAPSKIKDTEWIKPGLVSWNYWSNNHGTKDYQVVRSFADLAVRMGWPYTLLDWEWDSMSNGGSLEDAVNYIHSKGIKPLLWYNSGGDHTWVQATPKHRMLTHENRMKEFAWLQKLGFAGVKIDFFESEKQDMITYYLDILEDAAKFNMLVYFHGCVVPRGWARTYPHLMTYEGVMGAEWYNNVPFFTAGAPSHNTILPFTRNVVGAMDYTPVTFTNSQHPHITSYGHELALSVVFESALQHLADRPEGYDELPDAPKTFLKKVPAAWDDTKYIDGYPGHDAIVARRSGSDWFIGGINGESKEKTKAVKLDFLPAGAKYKMTLIADGTHDKAFATNYGVVDSSSTIEVKMLRRGGFAVMLVPVQ